ncbi:hypothetical protein ACFOWX_07335 [Sphingorhabdus arenilitoris]|uniref:DUF11 domain-containing protein n=1 Tax=Sphingorhabdus arenilitoris TaxID=1490041 RepID=A0ABV8RIC5_9SPHN
MKKLIISIFAPFIAILPVSAAHAASQVQLSSDVFVERTKQKPDGTVTTILEEPKLVTPGDNLVFVVKFKNAGVKPAEKFVVTNPLPKAVAFNGTADGLETVSIDGGKSWGFLSNLRVEDAEGKSRPALMADVTHIRWNLNQPLPAGSGGKLIFRGIVR